MLTISLSLPRHPFVDFLKEAVTMRLLIVCALFFAILTTGFVVANAREAHPSCSMQEKLLIYPKYDAKGTVIDERRVCGLPHRGCNIRAGTISDYDCSPFMAPKGALKW